jgi:hypothetical protein
MRPRAAVAGAVALGPSGASAHAIGPGSDPWSEVLLGAHLPASDPVLLLALLPLGLALGLWRTDGFQRVWPALAAGLVAGAVFAPFAGHAIVLAAILAGLVLALMGMASLRWPGWLVATASLGTGVVAGMAALQGHLSGALPVTVSLGVVLGGLVTVGVPNLLVTSTRERIRTPWVDIGWRIAASWIAAVALMLAALRVA